MLNESSLAIPRADITDGRALLTLLACLAIAFPTLIAFNVSPSATFFNQAAATVGWGGFLLALGSALGARSVPRSPGALALLASIGVLVLAALGASLWAGAPWSLTLSSVGTLLAAALAIAVGACVARAGLGVRAFHAVCVALVVAGVASSAIGLIQVFAPTLPDGDWIAPASIAGRATGNLRQPNHLSSLLLWSVVAAIWLGEARVIYREIAWMLAALFIEVIVLSASRTGLLGMFALLGWGLLDRRLSRGTRLFLLASPLVYLALWQVSTLWAHRAHLPFGGEERLKGSGLYVSYSRYKIWWNSLALIAQNPWLGVGFGEFNFAWSLTPFPDRPVAFFDHAHNLMLQFGVELGIPLALAVLGLMGFALWRAMQSAVVDGRGPGAIRSRLLGADEAAPPQPPAGATDASAPPFPMQRAAFVMVFMVGVHSLLEYPLWYSYFLLPAAFAFGLCLERPDPGDAAAAAADRGTVTRPWVLASLALCLAGTLALWDYMRVVIIFVPPAGAASLEKRIADGRHSVLFAHHADYAAATVTDHPGQAMKAFERAPHFLLDARLMLAWARGLAEAGETDKARYVAARLKEFRNEQADAFFAACDPKPAAGAELAAELAAEPVTFASASASAIASAMGLAPASGTAPASAIARALRAPAAASASSPAGGASAPSALPFQCSPPEKALSFRDFR